VFPEWDRIAGDTVAMLRTEAGRHPDDPELIELIGQLSTRSVAFRTRWAADDVRVHRGGTKTFRHPLIGQGTVSIRKVSLTRVSPGIRTPASLISRRSLSTIALPDCVCACTPERVDVMS